MKFLCRDRSLEMCESLKRQLAAEGIECVIRKDDTLSLFQQEPAQPDEPMPELWVVDDASFPRAWELLNDGSHAIESGDVQTVDD